MSGWVARLPLRLDPLIAEAKRRMRRRRLVLGAMLLMLAGSTLGAALALSPPASPHGSAAVNPSPAKLQLPGLFDLSLHPCGAVSSPVAWSPTGEQIAWYGHRWPEPPLHHRGASYTVLRAICVSDADGTHVQPLRYTACSERCPGPVSEPLGQLDWVSPQLFVFGSDAGVFALPVGQKPLLVGRTPPEPYSIDAAGDRVAFGFSSCPGCAGPVTVREVPSGTLVGKLGGKKLDNVGPSLSPDGTQVVFMRVYADDSGRTKGIWVAGADGSGLRRLERSGGDPLWSPAGDRISFVSSSGALRVVPAQGGASTLLLRPGFQGVIGWSPDGKRIALSDAKGRLAVVDVATRKVRTLLKLRPPWGPSSVVWSPDSQQLLVVWRPPMGSKCPSGLWRVPAAGGKPRLVHGC